MSKTIGIVVAVVIVIVAGYFLFRSESKPSDTVATDTPTETMMATTSETPEMSVQPPKGPVKTFTVTGSNFTFDVKEIKVNKGDTVKITFKDNGGMHDFVLDEFNVRTDRLETGDSATVTFVADKTGTFEYYCSVGTHRAMGMRGNLIVQ